MWSGNVEELRTSVVRECGRMEDMCGQGTRCLWKDRGSTTGSQDPGVGRCGSYVVI